MLRKVSKKLLAHLAATAQFQLTFEPLGIIEHRSHFRGPRISPDSLDDLQLALGGVTAVTRLALVLKVVCLLNY